MTAEEERLNTPVMRWCRRASFAVAIGTVAVLVLLPVVWLVLFGPAIWLVP